MNIYILGKYNNFTAQMSCCSRLACAVTNGGNHSSPGGERLDHWSCEAAGRQTFETLKNWQCRTNGVIQKKATWLGYWIYIYIHCIYIYTVYYMDPTTLCFNKNCFSWWKSYKHASLSWNITLVGLVELLVIPLTLICCRPILGDVPGSKLPIFPYNRG